MGHFIDEEKAGAVSLYRIVKDAMFLTREQMYDLASEGNSGFSLKDVLKMKPKLGAHVKKKKIFFCETINQHSRTKARKTGCRRGEPQRDKGVKVKTNVNFVFKK